MFRVCGYIARSGVVVYRTVRNQSVKLCTNRLGKQGRGREGREEETHPSLDSPAIRAVPRGLCVGSKVR
jgi:hypothetical protein